MPSRVGGAHTRRGRRGWCERQNPLPPIGPSPSPLVSTTYRVALYLMDEWGLPGLALNLAYLVDTNEMEVLNVETLLLYCLQLNN